MTCLQCSTELKRDSLEDIWSRRGVTATHHPATTDNMMRD